MSDLDSKVESVPKDHKRELLAVLLHYAPNGPAQAICSEMVQKMEADGIVREALDRQLVMTLADGLKYGNWPWTLQKVDMSTLPHLLEVGKKYKIRHKSTTQRLSHWSVMVYLGRDGSSTSWSARPLAGTQVLPDEWVISLHRVEESESVVMNKTWREGP